MGPNSSGSSSFTMQISHSSVSTLNSGWIKYSFICLITRFFVGSKGVVVPKKIGVPIWELTQQCAAVKNQELPLEHDRQNSLEQKPTEVF